MKQPNMILKCVLICTALLLGSIRMNAQLPMTRSIFTGTYTAIVGGTTSTATGDDAYEQNIPVGFSFTYLGTPYTQFSVATNGWMSFANLASYDAYSPDMYSTTTNAVLAPWWDDLSSSAIIYQTSGTPGTQVCTVQWTSLSYYTGSTRTINYQVKLYEATGVIEFCYGAAPTGTVYTGESACIGIKSATGGNGQYLDAVTGSAFTGNTTLQSDRWPAYNFRFTPGAPTAIAAGTYNVGIGQTYINLNEAAADVNHRGVSGPVVFNLVDAQYDVTVANGSNFFPILIGPIAGASAVNTTTFTKIGTASVVAFGGATGTSGSIANQASTTALASNVDPIIGLVGADYVTIDNLDIRGNVGNLVADHGVGVYNSSANDGATNNIIQNVSVTMNRANTGSRGFVQNVITTPASAAGANSNNTFKDFTITSVYAGIQILGNATNPDLNTMVTRTNCATFNTIGNPATANDIGNGTSQTYGISAANQSGFTIANNSIRNVSGSAVQTDGIVIVAFQGTCSVNNNKIQTIRNYSTSSTTGISGIRMSHTTTGTHTIRVYNNAVSEITSAYTGAASAARTLKGIFVNGTSGTTTQTYEIYNNNVSIDGSSSLNLSSVCFEVNTTSGPVYNLGNNIFANHTNTQTGIARHYCIASTSATALGNTGTTSDNNDFHLANDAGVSGFVGLGNATTYTSLANWQAAMVGLDAASISVNPSFVNNNSDLHASALVLNGVGMAPPAYITADLDCAARTPDNDLGAYVLIACSGMPTAGTITGTATVCSGTGTTLTLTGATTGAGITYQWASATVSGGPYTTLLGTSLTQATGPVSVPTYYVVGVGCSVSGLAAVTTEFAILINPLPTVAVTPSTGSICNPSGTPVALTASGATTYTWLPVTGLTPSTGANVSANPGATTTYTVTGTDGNGCVNTATATITVGEAPSMTPATATPASVCSGGNSQLLASAGTTSSYAVTNIPFASVPTPGSGVTTLANAGVAVTALSAGTLDDGGWASRALPFNFMFFGTSYNSFAVSTNGFVFLGTGAPNTYTGYSTTFPSTTSGRPSIGAVYSDLDFRTIGTINYFTTGIAPNRTLVINWSGGNFYNTIGLVNTQVIIYETTNVIEVHTTSSTGTNNAVQSIQNAAGTTAVTVAGRNNVTWAVSTPDAYRWAPTGGPVTYSWSPATFLSSTTINNPMANAVTATTTYTVTATAGACASTSTVTITAGSVLTATGGATPSTTVCENTNVTLNSTPIGGGAPYTYSWTGPNTFTSTSQNPSISGVTPAATGVYTVVITDNCATSFTVNVTLAVNPAPTITSTPTAASYCIPGAPVSLTASGSSVSYSWSPATGLSATTGANVDASPSTSTTYTVTGTAANGCTSNATAVITAAPAVTTTAASTPAAVCFGTNTATLDASSTFAITYCQPVYSNGTGFGDYVSSVVLNTLSNATAGSPTPYYTLYPASGSTTTTLVAGNTYTVTLVAGTYTINDLAAWIDFNQNGTLNDASEKLGETDNLGAAPANTSFIFTVPAGAFNGTTRFRVRDVDHGGTNDMDPCTAQSSFGETEDYIVTITGGVDPVSYVWTPATFLGSTTGSSVTATNATTTTTYTVTATSGAGCSATSSTTLTVNPLPTVALSGTNTFCAGDSSLLTGTGGGTSQWFMNGVAISGATSNTYYATAAGVYNMTKTNLNGCLDSAAVGITVTVNALPGVTANASATTVCSGSSVTLTGSGAVSYAWSGGQTDGVAFNATATTNYTVTGTDGNGCSNIDSVLVTVNALPVVALGADITQCGGSTTLDAGNVGSTYLWSDASTLQTLSASASGTFDVAVTDGNGCVGNDTIVVTINALPVVALGADVTQCGGSVMLDAGNVGSTYLWSDNSTSQMLTASASGTYDVAVTDGNGCVGNDTIVVTINTIPVVALGADSTQCGGTVTLDAQNVGDSYLWNDNSLSQTLVASTSGIYWVDVTNSSGCTTRDSITVTINAVPTVALGNDSTSCGSITLDAGNVGSTYLWSDNSTNQTLTASTSGTYFVDVTTAAGCAGSDTVAVTINTPPTVTFSIAQTSICVDDADLTLTGSPAGGVFSGSNVTGSTFDPTAATAGTYAVTYTFTDANGCSASQTDSITVSACVGIAGTDLNLSAVVIYPNPNAGQFTIQLNAIPTSPVTVEITDALGQIVSSFTMTGTTQQVDLGQFASGVYSMKVTDGNNTGVYRIISNK